MGAEYSSRPTLPEGGVCLAIEHDTAGCGPCGRRQWSDGPRPAWLSMRDGDWAAFSSEVGQLVRSYAPEGWGHVFMLVGFLVGLFVFHPSLGIVRTLDFELSASIGLMMFCLRGLFAKEGWSDRMAAWSFWLLNGGLAMMVFMSLFPVGVIQAHASITEGLWFARSPEVLQSELVHFFVWMRVPGDIVFSVGAGVLAVFVAKLAWTGFRSQKTKTIPVGTPAE